MSDQIELPAEQLSHLIATEFAGSSSPASIQAVASVHVMIARLVDAVAALAKLQNSNPEMSRVAVDQLDQTVKSLLNEMSDNIKRLAKENLDAGRAS